MAKNKKSNSITIHNIKNSLYRQVHIDDARSGITPTEFTSSTDYTYMSKQINSAPEKLKRAMFRTSSRGIATVLKKK